MSLKRVITLGAGDTISTEVRGPGDTVYRLQPRIWLKQIVDAAKKRQYFTQFAYTTQLQKGQKDIVIPRRRRYLGSGTAMDWAGGGGLSEGSAVSYTAQLNLSGVTVSPSATNYGFAVTNETLRVTAVDHIRACREDLVYVAGDEVDRTVAATMSSDTNRASSTLIGSQAMYGGDATSAATLATNDTFTVDMVAEAKRRLQTTICKYWTYGTSESISSERKNPWQNEPRAPFVLFIAPEQEEVLLTDSQFVNASEYGGREVVANGEIGSYLGCKIVVANNTPYYPASDTHADGTTTAVAQHRCMMAKSQKAVALAYGQKPKLYVFPYPSELETRLIIEQSFAASMLQPDAIVHINVADS